MRSTYVRTALAAALGVIGALGLPGCQAPNIVEQALMDATDSQRAHRADELERLSRDREARLRDYETTLASQEDRYGELCAWTLARAHARSGDRIAIAAYLGKGRTFDDAVTEFAVEYAAQNARDHAELVKAIESGQITAQTGV